MEENKWIPREGYALTLDEIHFLFEEYLNNYAGNKYADFEKLEIKVLVREIERLRSWLTNAAISGMRL